MSRLTRFLPIALVISVLVNVFVIGWGIARVARRHHGGGGMGEHPMTPTARQLWHERAPRLRAHREAVDAQRHAVAEALRREPFDPVALDSALLALRSSTADGQLDLHQTIAELARQLPAEERQRLAASRWVLGPLPPSPRGH